jgi:phosphatidylglycerol---prolipoprotein diacylglyceryl transferase
MRKVSTLSLIDLCAAAAPIGLGFGRLANFANGELWGRVSTVPWAMVFPDGGPLPRHPSQVYEALTEGVLLFLVLWYAVYGRLSLRRPGTVTGLFLAGYGLARIVCEHFREDTDPQIGLGLVTSGQMYSIPMILAGIGLFIWSQRAGARPSGSATVGTGSVA